MADLEKEFEKYLEKITLSSTRRDQLKTSRDSDREAIQDYFKNEIEVIPPTFHMQGSFKMGTIINPLNQEYDLDDGVYLQHLSANRNDWPKPATLHNYVKEALKGKTSTSPIDKDTCVRLRYKNDYHIDFPIYGMCKDVQYLANKSKDWIESYPKRLTQWFSSKIQNDGEQIRRLVRYIKGWKDYKEDNIKFPSGMILTILAVNYHKTNDEDQLSFLQTCNEIHNHLSDNFYLERPVSPYENLFENYTSSRKNNFLDKLQNLINDGRKAIELPDSKAEEASNLWQKHFGDRFPLANNIQKGSSDNQGRVYINIDSHQNLQQPWQKL